MTEWAIDELSDAWEAIQNGSVTGDTRTIMEALDSANQAILISRLDDGVVRRVQKIEEEAHKAIAQLYLGLSENSPSRYREAANMFLWCYQRTIDDVVSPATAI